MELYRMPNGVIRQFNGNAPEGAILLKKPESKPEPKAKPEVKAVEEIQNKAVEAPKNKKKGGSKK